MRIIQRIADWLRELEINSLLNVVADPDMPRHTRTRALLEAHRLIGQRSAGQVARMERQRGLV